MVLPLRGLLVVGIVSSGAVLFARAPQAGNDAAARAALADMYAAYRGVDALHVKVTWTARYTGAMTADDFPVPGPDTLELRMQRPNRFFLSAASKRLGTPTSYQIVSDGTTLWFWRSATNVYLQTNAPATLAGLPALLPDDAIGTTDGSTWEIDSILEWDLLTTDETPLAGPVPGMRLSATPEKLGGSEVVVVRIGAEPGQMPFVMEQRINLDSATHLVRGLGTTARGKNPENGRDFSVEIAGTYDIHTARPSFTDADFRFVPPRGARRGGG